MIRFLMRPKLALILAWAVTFTGVAAQPAHAGGLPSQLLFVETEQGSINIYSLDNPQAGTVGVITGLAALQAQMAVDKSNDLFVTNNGAYGNYFYVSEFKPPYNKTPVILSTAFGGSTLFPVGVTVNAQGTVFVADCGADCSDASTGILVYPKGATAPAKEITSPPTQRQVQQFGIDGNRQAR